MKSTKPGTPAVLNRYPLSYFILCIPTNTTVITFLPHRKLTPYKHSVLFIQYDLFCFIMTYFVWNQCIRKRNDFKSCAWTGNEQESITSLVRYSTTEIYKFNINSPHKYHPQILPYIYGILYMQS